jgi:ubiquinone biosynthesis protein UbiJ
MIGAQINAVLDRAVATSPRARTLCLALEGRRLRIAITGVPLQLLVTAVTGSLQVARERDQADQPAADVTVRGSPLALLAAAGGEVGAGLASGGVSISGEEQLAQQFQELARLLRPDFETILGRVLGRVNAHLAVRALGKFASWGRAAGATVLRNTADYLAHESRDLVSRAEAESFLGGVEALRAQLRAAESRAVSLSAGLERLAAPQDQA